jgi:hypothetical protein
MQPQLSLLRNNLRSIKIYYCLIVIFCCINCQQTRNITGDIIAPNWQNIEKLKYLVTRNDTTIGQADYSVYTDIEEETSVYILNMLTITKMDQDNLWDSSVVYFRRDNFTPVRAWRKVVTNLGYTIIETHYNGNKADVWIETIDGKKTFNYTIRKPYFDNEMILTLMRSVRFAKAKRYTFNVFMPFSLQMTPVTVSSGNITTITTSAGTFECDRVSLSSLQNIYQLYYERQEPRRLIRYQEKKSNIALVLTRNI